MSVDPPRSPIRAAARAAWMCEARSERTGDAPTTVQRSRCWLVAVRSAPVPVEPLVDLVGVEANEVADLVVGDPCVADEPADVPHARGDVASNTGDVEQLSFVVGPAVAGRMGTHV